ncbi:MAG: hypothetical protein ACYSTI_13500 [Planctomycetota bacterium]
MLVRRKPLGASGAVLTLTGNCSMADYYYSTQTFLAWCLNHYFHDGNHWVWLAKPVYPYRLPNPKSSNPFLIYQDLYMPWKDQDDFDKSINQARLNLRKGVTANEGKLQPGWKRRLERVCDTVHIVFFYPIVYRVDITNIPQQRRLTEGSGLVRSDEYLIKDLLENEFEILFLDFKNDRDFATLQKGSVTREAALEILEGRSK